MAHTSLSRSTKPRLVPAPRVIIAWIVLLGGLAASLACGHRDNARTSVGELGQKIVKFAESSESAGFTGAILAAKNGSVVAAVGVGSADLEGKTPNTPDTLFEIASATKQFTAAALLRLVQQKRVSLDDSIAVHLPAVPENCRTITVRHLLHHTSGIPGTNSAGGGDDIARVIPLFLRGGPKHPPGTHFEYWNQGYALLSAIVAAASRKEYTAYCKDELFAPAGLRGTLFTGDRAPPGAAVAVGRSVRGKPRSALDHPYGSYGFQYRGMGGVVTSVSELWRWDRALSRNQVLDEASKASFFKPGLGNYALGWFVKKNARGNWVQSHGGGVRGFVCELRRYPEIDGCLFVLCNRDDVPVQAVADALEALLFGDRLPCAEPPRPLDADLAALSPAASWTPRARRSRSSPAAKSLAFKSTGRPPAAR